MFIRSFVREIFVCGFTLPCGSIDQINQFCKRQELAINTYYHWPIVFKAAAAENYCSWKKTWEGKDSDTVIANHRSCCNLLFHKMSIIWSAEKPGHFNPNSIIFRMEQNSNGTSSGCRVLLWHPFTNLIMSRIYRCTAKCFTTKGESVAKAPSLLKAVWNTSNKK